MSIAAFKNYCSGLRFSGRQLDVIPQVSVTSHIQISKIVVFRSTLLHIPHSFKVANNCLYCKRRKYETDIEQDDNAALTLERIFSVYKTD